MDFLANGKDFAPATIEEQTAIINALNTAPTLGNLTAEQLKEIAKVIMFEQCKNELKKTADKAKIDLAKEKQTFLLNISKTGSKHTYKAYSKSLVILENWTQNKSLDILDLKPIDADNFIYDLKAMGKSPATIRLYTACTSSFYSFLARRFSFVQNPFRGTKARPPKKNTRKCIYPDSKEIKVICDNLPRQLSVIALIMANNGLREGAFEHLELLRGGAFKTVSKGKEYKGKFKPFITNAINDTSLDFSEWTPNRIKCLFTYYTRKLAKNGVIKDAYSPHDLRHYFAVSEYKKDKDIYRVSKLLNHSSIQTTEIYLRGLDVLE